MQLRKYWFYTMLSLTKKKTKKSTVVQHRIEAQRKTFVAQHLCVDLERCAYKNDTVAWHVHEPTVRLVESISNNKLHRPSEQQKQHIKNTHTVFINTYVRPARSKVQRKDG